MSSQKKQRKKKHGATFYEEIFDSYKQWRSLPALWKKMDNDELKKKFGIDDEETLSLLELRTQGDFAKKFGIAIETTSDWNHKIDDEGNEYEQEMLKWARKLSKNVMMAHYNKIIRKTDPVSVDLWYKRIDNWNEKKQIEHSGKMTLYDLAKMSDDEDEPKK